MNSKLENRVWLSVEIDNISYKLNEFNKILSYICIAIVAVAAAGTFKDSNGASVGMLLLLIPVLLVHIWVWKLIRKVCMAVSLLLSDTVTDEGEKKEENE